VSASAKAFGGVGLFRKVEVPPNPEEGERAATIHIELFPEYCAVESDGGRLLLIPEAAERVARTILEMIEEASAMPKSRWRGRFWKRARGQR